ncbi:HTH-type transcriptional regulator BenM [Pseudovibrio axinellae]|uniref:HTH-type transcriptional regulator BenM n=1 Tax=Pseudovibrio axinellae TaxID=989403 RepID=A0A166BC72_9HYPH|nr:LysR substrate-binding domain-containing protein [Pseudovibrio axinellae]KZL22116.1 HTH-type transcriptional regulator BenM [Pseudovibrio axinellae]SEQ54633.1 DNA-binding transcriptional regulator, LysR family [Pseudovibrio axinellae]
MHDLINSGRITLRMLRYFHQVAVSGHFGRAAEELHISKSPMSIQIKELEGALGLSLFHRDSRNVSLTATGRALKLECEQVFNALDNAITNTQRQGRAENSTLSIGIVSSAFLDGFANLLSDFKAKHPDCSLNFTELAPNQQKEALHGGVVDLGICRYVDTLNEPTLNSRVLVKENLTLAVPNTHPLKDRRLVALAELKDEEIAVLDRTISNSTPFLVSKCKEHGFYPKMTFEVQEPSTLLALVASGQAIALVSDCFRSQKSKNVRFIRLKEEIPADLCAIYKKNYQTPILNKFLQFIEFDYKPQVGET